MSNFANSCAAVLAGAVLLCTLNAFAAEEINMSADGLGLHGYDPVAYFSARKPVAGDTSLKLTYKGVTYLFSSAENRDAFEQRPEKFMPAYGGYCSYGVRVGKKFDVDPTAFVIDNGRLFMLLDFGTQKVWNKDRAKNIDIADRLWPKIASVPAKTLAD